MSETPKRRRPTTAAWLAGVLAVVLVGLVGSIAILSSGGLPIGGSATPGPSAPPPSVGQSTAPPSQSPAPSFTRPTPTPRPTFVVHVVKPGDSLTSIARAQGTTARSIAFWNRDAYPSLDPESDGYQPNRIEVGWALALVPGQTYDELAPTQRPGSPPPNGPSTAAGPGSQPTMPPVIGSSVLISNGPRGSDRIALTLDMGGRVDPAVEIVRWLIDHTVKATLFPTGLTGTTSEQGRAALLLAAQRPDLFEIANHSWDHPSFVNLTDAEVADQLSRSEAAVNQLIGRTTKPFFRPPFGAVNNTVRGAVGRAGWGYTILWDIDTIDWKPTSEGGPTASDIVTKVTAQAQGGSIVVMDLGGWHTLEALPGILAALDSKGLRPVTLTEMLAP
ncbi:MAG: polysaccharide deacetylase family protein [Chloroflexota bacterium]